MNAASRIVALLAIGVTPALVARAGAQTATPAAVRHPTITSISVCGAGVTATASCPDGTFDTQQDVLATDTGGMPLNQWNVGTAVDEHSSVFPPHAFGNNPDYIFFLAAGTHALSTSPLSPAFTYRHDIGIVVLSGRPGRNGTWQLKFAPGYGSVDVNGDIGPVFLPPTGPSTCPSTSQGPDTTFDLSYASGGSVMFDPTSPSGDLLLLYEGANDCMSPGKAAIALGIATSHDDGRTWPVYAPTSTAANTFAYAPLPYLNTAQGPGLAADAGGLGAAVCIPESNDTCNPHLPYAGYGRYPVLSPPAAPGVRDGQPAGFVDEVRGRSTIYVYTVQNYNPAGSLPDGRADDITIARAPLNGGSGPLAFEKWNGQPCATGTSCWIGPADGALVNYAPEYQILKDSPGDFADCEDVTQARSSASISYVGETDQYLLTFVCHSASDPGGSDAANPQPGAAWFFSTSPDLADPTLWTTPREIRGSWTPFPQPLLFNGWYATFMSLDKSPGLLSTSGYVFYMWGCESAGCNVGRTFTSRQFHIQTTDNVYSRPPVTRIDGPASYSTHMPVQSFAFQSTSAGSAFECSLDGAAYAACASSDTFLLEKGANVLRVRAINPFGTVGAPATVRVTYEPFVIEIR